MTRLFVASLWTAIRELSERHGSLANARRAMVHDRQAAVDRAEAAVVLHEASRRRAGLPAMRKMAASGF
jgi:hypothetical protein